MPYRANHIVSHGFFFSPVQMKAVIDSLWDKYAHCFYKQMALYFLWLMCFLVYANTLAWHGGALFDGTHPFNGTRPAMAGVMHVMSLASSVLLELYFASREWRQNREEKGANVASWNSEHSFWNCLQILTHSFFWLVIIMNLVVLFTDNATLTVSGSSGTEDGTKVLDVLRVVVALSSILMWIGWLHYFRGYRPTSYIIRMFTSIYWDFPPFFAVVFVQVIGFALGFRVIYSGYKEDYQTCELTDDGGSIGICDEVQTGYDSFWRSIFTAFLAGFLG